MKLTTTLVSTALVVSMIGLANAADQEITDEEVIAAQQEWADALIAIATAYDNEGAEKAREVAIAAIEDLYNYENEPVLFKPTLAQEPHRFRTTEEGAIAYFIGGNADFAGDSGFALKGWRAIDIDNAAIFTDGSVGISMGDVTLTDANGNTVSVDKTWAFQELENGDVVIVLHHSSLPYTE
ncbi:MAG: phosphoribosyl-AMP cyclohydrolase [Pseudomonadota bacterium]